MRQMKSYLLMAGLGGVLLLMPACASGPEKPAEELPVYLVRSSDLPRNEAAAFGRALGLGDRLLESEGELPMAFTDSKRFRYVATRVIGRGEPDENGQETILEELDLEAVRAMPAIDPEAARNRFERALEGLALDLERGQTRTAASTFRAFDREGNLLVEKPLDVKLSRDLRLGGLPLVGPGARISATFDGEGEVTRYRYVRPVLERGPAVPMLPASKARERCIELYRMSLPKAQPEDFDLNLRRVYYVPPRDLETVRTILPYYECGGVATLGERKVDLMDHLIPALDSPKLVPRLRLETTVARARITARVEIEGGSPPYRIEWTGDPGRDRSSRTFRFDVRGRKATDRTVVTVRVIDANGVSTVANQTVHVEVPELAVGELANVNACTDYCDFGTENAVTHQFGDLEQGFYDEMLADGEDEYFCWTGTWAWEQDFKAPNDSIWIDNVDIALYVGHGNGDGFTFEDTTHQDGELDYNDATGDWGDKNLEWLALYSCQVLEADWSGMSRFDRWKQEFDGLHLLLGFETNASVSSYFTGKFAKYMLQDNKTIRQAWFDAIADHQPSDRVGVVMGVFGPASPGSRPVWNYSDHYWGKGSVGPDIRGRQISGYWSVSGP